MQGQLKDVGDVARFMFAGNATLTLVSNKTGARYTYRVKRAGDADPENPRKNQVLYFVSALTGPDNENSFSYLGLFREGKGYEHGRKSKICPDATSALAFDWFAKNFARQEALNKALEVWHEGKCGRCGRKLTVPSSIERGLGPECAGHICASE